MEIIIAGIVYFIVGIAYINATPNVGYKGEWVVKLLFAFIWPYFMLNRFFKHRIYIAEQKRFKAHKEANS